MATIRTRKNVDGSKSYTALVRIAGFNPTAETFPDLKAAKHWAAETEKMLKVQRERGGVHREVAAQTVEQLVQQFLGDPETVRLKYFDELHRMLSWWTGHHGTRKAIELNVLVLREARETLRKGRGPATVNRYLSAMRSCWNWGRSAGLLPRDHLWPERLMLTEPKGRTRFLSDGELAALLKAARAHSTQMYALIVTAIATGVRQGELLRLDWSDLDLVKQTLRIRVSKNGEQRTVYLPTSAIDALRRLKGGKVVGMEPVFILDDGARLTKTTNEGRWRLLRDKVGLQDLRWHDLRHSCASFLAQQGATLMQIGAQLGHKSPAVTMRYSHLVEGAALPAHAVFDTKLKI